MSSKTDPIVKNARREAIIIGLSWLAATVYCCAYCYWAGYIRAGRNLTKADVQPVLGMPSWFFFGVIVPWGVCAVFMFWFAGFYMADDDLGEDHSDELERDIREGGLYESGQ